MIRKIEVKKSIAVISDTHIGAERGLFLPEWKDEEGHEYKASKFQSKLWEHWLYFLKKCDEFGVDTVIHLGDLIQGYNKKECGERLLISDMNKQIEVAVEIMKIIKKNRKFFIVSGSPYHEANIKIHKILADRIDGVYCGFITNLEVKECKRTINIAHSLGNPSVYLSTAVDREILFTKFAEGLEKITGKIDLLLRGHLHHFLEIHQIRCRGILVPCWQGFEGYNLTTKLFSRKIPDVGGIILVFDKDNKIYTIPYLMDYSFTDILQV